MSPYLRSFGKLIAGLCVSICFLGAARSQYFPRRSQASESTYLSVPTVNLAEGAFENEETIVKRFIDTESRQRAALNRHMFKRDVILQTIAPGGEVTGEYIRNSEFLFDDKGRRIERLIYHPPSTIREMRITPEDILLFPARDVHYRITVRYYDYKLFACQVNIKEIDDVPPNQ